MKERVKGADIGKWGKVTVVPGERRDVALAVAESNSGRIVDLPVHVWRASRSGPTVFVTAAVHGDEINGTGAIRHIVREPPFELLRGALILVPVANLFGFERHSRYLPDRRDLNRSFPGSATGSMAARLANVLMKEIVELCDYGIDLHTAAARRTNFPHVRADMADQALADAARGLGCSLIIDSKGPKGSLRRVATDHGCPTMVLEAGESLKVEAAILESMTQAIRNFLISLKMVEGKRVRPPFETTTRKTRWIRAESGGFLQFHVGPGDVVTKGDPLATNTSLTGTEQNVLHAPASGVVIGMTTLPAVAPGDAVCHLAPTTKTEFKKIIQALSSLPEASLASRLRNDLASSISVKPAVTAGD